MKVITEEDKRKREYAEKLSNDLFQRIKEYAKENNLDPQRDFRKIIEKFTKEEK